MSEGLRGIVQQKINVLLDTFISEPEDLELILQALNEPIREFREVAYWLLTESSSETAQQVLRNYLPYAKMQHLHTITGQVKREPNYFVISTKRKALISNCYSREVKGYAYEGVNIWNLQTGELIDSPYLWHEHIGTGQDGQILVGHFQHIIQMQKGWEESEETFQFGCIDDNDPMTNWETTNGDIGTLTVSPDEAKVACGEFGAQSCGRITVWNLSTRKMIHSLQWQPSHRIWISSLIISPDSLLLLSQDKIHGSQRRHQLWNLEIGELVREFETSPYWFADAVATTPDGRYLVSGIRDKIVKVWNLESDQVIYSFQGFAPTAMTPDGKVMAYCDETNGIAIWDLDRHQHICTLAGSSAEIQALCLSSDREWVVSYSSDQKIRVYGLPDVS